MGAQPRPKPEDRPVIVPLHRKEAPPRCKARSGFAMVPKDATAMPELPAGAHRVLTGIIGLCYDRGRMIASLAAISQASATPVRSVKRYLAVLIERKMIVRRRDFSLSNAPVVTYLSDQCTFKPRVGQIGPSRGQPGPPRGQPGPAPLVRIRSKNKIVVVPPTIRPDDDASSSTPVLNAFDPDLIAQARAAWPAEPARDARLAELFGLDPARAAAALETALRRGKKLGYAFTLLKSWRNLGAAECAEIAAEAAAGPRAKGPTRPVAPPAHVAVKPPAQDLDPVYADLFRRFRQANGPRKAELRAAMEARSAELEAGTAVPT